MEETIQSALTPITIAALAGIFIIVLVCSQRAIREMPFFAEGPTWLIAFGVAMLSIIGIVQYFGSPEQSAPAQEEPKKPGGLLDFVLLPYVVLALGILFVLLLAAIEQLGRYRQARRLSRASSKIKAQMRLCAKKGSSRPERTNPLMPPQGHRQSLENRKER